PRVGVPGCRAGPSGAAGKRRGRIERPRQSPEHSMPEALRVSIRPVAALLAALCVALSSPFAAGQDGPSTSTPEPQTDGQQPTFRGGVTYVSVDVYPRRDGRIVEGLTIDDFEILEDGVPQAIDRFEFVRVEGQPVDGDRIDPTSQADGDRQ